jgi:hypothetical protein
MINFRPWGRFLAKRDKSVDARFMDAAAHESEDALRKGLASPKSGIHHPGLPRRSSAPGEYPANQSGKLRGSIRTSSSATRMDIGTTAKHAKYLRWGTVKMARRKMSPEAMAEGIPKARSVLRGWVAWAKG